MKSMKLKSLKLQNYKKHIDSFFEFGDDVNIILGENNSGKSTLLEVLNAIFNDDPKIFKDFPNVVLEAKFDDNFCKLNFGRTPKFDWSGESRPTIPAFVPVHMTTAEIEKILSSFLENQLKANEELASILNEEFSNFQNSLNLNDISTRHIKEENDLYNLNHLIEYKKMFTFSFGAEPTSIRNKGMGQQKEFILNYFIQKSTISNNTDYLFVDEIENSLSVESMIKIVNSLCDLNKQIFLTSHSSAILETKVSSIILIGPAPKAIFKNKKFIYLEGPSDFKVFSRIFPEVKFMTANGGVDKVAGAYKRNGDDFAAIVDGDIGGINYRNKIARIDSTFSVWNLKKGCIEDYYDEQSKTNAYSSVSLTIPAPIPNDFLHNSPLDNVSIPLESIRKQKRDDIKKHLEINGIFSDDDLKDETDSFILKNW